ncbi:hypothetical protein SFR_1508 [Streptomyces sp. FR-008]|nr:hypothetical protein SFR_1508 [Streptomyces sp. FR-008]
MEPVPQLLVGEPVPGSRRNDQPLGQHRRGAPRKFSQPAAAGAPGEQRLEAFPVQFPLPRSQAAAGRLVELSGDPRRDPAQCRAPQPVRGGEPDRRAQAHQVEVGREDRVPVERQRRAVLARARPLGGVGHPGRQGAPDVGQEPQREGVAGVPFGEQSVGEAVPGAGLRGGGLGEVPERHAVGDGAPRLGFCGAMAERAGEEAAHLLPVLGAASHDQFGAGPGEPRGGARRPGGEAVGEGGRHLLGPVEQQHQGAPRPSCQPRDLLGRRVLVRGRPVRRVAARRLHDAGGAGQRTPRGVAHVEIVREQVRASQPHRRRRVRPGGAARGERRQLRGAPRAGRPDQPEDQAGPVLEGGEFRGRPGPFHRGCRGALRPLRADRRRGQLERPREVEPGAERGDGRLVAGQQRGEGTVWRVPDGGAQRHRETSLAPHLQRGGEDREDLPGGCVEHRRARRSPAGPGGVPAVGADGQFEAGRERPVRPVPGERRGAQHPGLPPAPRRHQDVGAACRFPGRDRQRHRHESRCAQQREPAPGQQGDGVGPDAHRPRATGAVGAAHQQFRGVAYRLVRRDDGAPVVGEEAAAEPAPRGVLDAEQRSGGALGSAGLRGLRRRAVHRLRAGRDLTLRHRPGGVHARVAAPPCPLLPVPRLRAPYRHRRPFPQPLTPRP